MKIMEIKDVVVSSMVVLVAVIAITSWINNLNTAYSTTAGSSFNSTLSSTQSLLQTNMSNIAVVVANNTQVQEGAGTSDQEQSLLEQSRGTFSILTDLLGIIPSMIEDGAEILDIPDEYTFVAKWTFLFVFGLTIAYLFLLGVKSWISR